MTKQIETIANDPHARYNKVAGGYATKLMNQKNAEIEDWIDEYNDVIIDINPTRSKLNNAFQDKLRANLSTNAYDAQNGNWTNVSDKNVEYWDDKPLRFTKHEGTGTYLVEQQDENGNWVAMGYTSKDIAYEYTQEFMQKEPPEPPVPQPEPTPDTQPESTWVGNEILKHEDIVVKPGEKIFLKPGNGETVYLASDPDMTVTYKYDVTSGTYKSDSPGDFNEYNPRDLITAHKETIPVEMTKTVETPQPVNVSQSVYANNVGIGNTKSVSEEIAYYEQNKTGTVWGTDMKLYKELSPEAQKNVAEKYGMPTYEEYK